MISRDLSAIIAVPERKNMYKFKILIKHNSWLESYRDIQSMMIVIRPSPTSTLIRIKFITNEIYSKNFVM